MIHKKDLIQSYQIKIDKNLEKIKLTETHELAAKWVLENQSWKELILQLKGL